MAAYYIVVVAAGAGAVNDEGSDGFDLWAPLHSLLEFDPVGGDVPWGRF